jgi:hypothetical protein
MKIFYSWQSDTDRRVGKDLVRDALDAAVADLDVDEAQRPTVDQDTAGVLGSPVIANTILEKIAIANVVVADVTLTGKTDRGKPLINSNVAIELGYALRAHGDDVLLKVMNTAFGGPEDLPFDLRHRRWPVRYNLPSGSDKAAREKVLKELAGELKHVIAAYVAANARPPEPFVRAEPTINPASFWQPDEKIVVPDTTWGQPVHEPLGITADQPLFYLRVWPSSKVNKISAAIFLDHNKSILSPLGRGGHSWERNRYGLVTYRFVEGYGLAAATQLFASGEIWAFNAYYFRGSERGPIIPTGAIEQTLKERLPEYLDRATKHYGYPAAVNVECGFVNVRNWRLALTNTDFSSPIYDNVTHIHTLDMSSADPLKNCIAGIMRAIYEAAGEVYRS